MRAVLYPHATWISRQLLPVQKAPGTTNQNIAVLWTYLESFVAHEDEMSWHAYDDYCHVARHCSCQEAPAELHAL
jgi:hypothetical protein